MNNRIKAFFQKILVGPIRRQLTQGASAKGLALTVAFGMLIGVFPIIGSTTLLCVLFGTIFKLNQPILQSVNYVLYPLQILLVPAFISAGAWVTGADPISFNPKTIVQEFIADTPLFFKTYGMAGLQGVLVWCLVAPVLIWIFYRVFFKLFVKWRKA